MDDGQYGSFGSAIDNGLNLVFNTASNSIVLTPGLTYRFKYSGENIEGEGL